MGAVGQVDCRLLFATHYHPLTAEFDAPACGELPRVALGHMAALVGERPSVGGGAPGGADASAGSGTPSRSITFLYKLRPGACPASYGLQVNAGVDMPLRALSTSGYLWLTPSEHLYRNREDKAYVSSRTLQDESFLLPGS